MLGATRQRGDRPGSENRAPKGDHDYPLDDKRTRRPAAGDQRLARVTERRTEAPQNVGGSSVRALRTRGTSPSTAMRYSFSPYSTVEPLGSPQYPAGDT